MELKSILFILFFIGSIALFVKNLGRILSYIYLAHPMNRKGQFWARFKHTLVVAIGQTKIFREPIAGPVHALIFWGFLVLLFSAAEAVFQGFYPPFNWDFLGSLNTVIGYSTDIFCALVIVSVIISLIRRFVIKVPRLQGDSGEKKDAVIVLGMIFTIVTGLLFESAASIVLGHHTAALRPVSGIISAIIPAGSAYIIYEIAWWIHITAILVFMNYLPFSKHFHVYTSITDVYFANLQPTNKLDRIDFEKEGVEKFGVVDIDDLNQKNILDSYSCTHCGRCTSVCPANTTGKILDPREIIIQMRARTLDVAPIMQRQRKAIETGSEYTPNEHEQAILNKKLVGDYISIEALWQCTTCGACMEECPIQIEHVPAIVGMRRSLVMMEANFPAEVQPAFTNLENNATPWAFSPAERADWAEGTGVKTAAESPDFDILFWVGCSGSYDDRAKKISLAFSKLMQLADIKFAILGTEEQCNGDFARRTGNEYLADTLVKANIETLNRYNVKKIVTTCPHCFNTIKNEYPDFGGNYEVIHHSEYLQSLIEQGKLKVKGNAHSKVAYHDSCYIGRYNKIYDAPRKALEHVGVEIQEPARTKDKGFCCGAGGGRMFMEETVGKRVNIERTEELLKCGANTIALNCPFCMTMITDGIKDKEMVDQVQVKDIAEIILENVE
jgi:Fe-S oxidoreductase